MHVRIDAPAAQRARALAYGFCLRRARRACPTEARRGVGGPHRGSLLYSQIRDRERVPSASRVVRASSVERLERQRALPLAACAHASNRRRYIFSSPKVPHERSSTVWSLGTLISRVVHLTRLKLLLARVLQSAAQGSSSAARNLVLGVGRVPASPGARSSERLRANRMPRLTSSVSGMRALM